MPAVLPKLGLLSAAVRQITNIYVSIDYFQPRLLAAGGKNEEQGLRHTLMQKEKAVYVEALARDVAKGIDAVIGTLSV